jgi:hypothetical protein
MKIRYIELKPVKQTLEFDNNETWREFFDKRISEILDYTLENNIHYKDYYKYERVLLKKDGTPRKQTERPNWLWTKDAQAKQKKNWLAYVEKRKKETAQRNACKKIAELDFKISLLQKEKEELLYEN